MHVAPVELDENDVASRAFNDRGHLGPVTTQQQVTLPVAGNGAVLGFGRSFADRHGVFDLGSPLPGHGVVQVAASRPTGPQMLLQLLGQDATGLHEQRLVDRLVRHRHPLTDRVLLDEHTGDLLR